MAAERLPRPRLVEPRGVRLVDHDYAIRHTAENLSAALIGVSRGIEHVIARYAAGNPALRAVLRDLQVDVTVARNLCGVLHGLNEQRGRAPAADEEGPP